MSTVTVVFQYRWGKYGPGVRAGFAPHIAKKLCTAPGPQTHTRGEPYAVYAEDFDRAQEKTKTAKRQADAVSNRAIGLPWSERTVEELKEELRTRDLPVTGRKKELIERLEDFG